MQKQSKLQESECQVCCCAVSPLMDAAVPPAVADGVKRVAHKALVTAPPVHNSTFEHAEQVSGLSPLTMRYIMTLGVFYSKNTLVL